MTHNDLVQHGREYMAKKSPIVITELKSVSEEPDVIAFGCVRSGKLGYGSVLLECKATRSDFKSDAKKSFRRYPDAGMGNYRYYFAPTGLITVDELPDRWGLIEVSDKGKMRIRQKAEYIKANARNEVKLLVSTLRRLNIETGGHTSIRMYEYQSKNTASLTRCKSETELLVDKFEEWLDTFEYANDVITVIQVRNKLKEIEQLVQELPVNPAPDSTE